MLEFVKEKAKDFVSDVVSEEIENSGLIETIGFTGTMIGLGILANIGTFVVMNKRVQKLENEVENINNEK